MVSICWVLAWSHLVMTAAWARLSWERGSRSKPAGSIFSKPKGLVASMVRISRSRASFRC